MDGIVSLPGVRAAPEGRSAGGAAGPTTLLCSPERSRSASGLPAAVGFARCSRRQKRSPITEPPRGSWWVRSPLGPSGSVPLRFPVRAWP